jgi:hypothetical protein
MNCSYSRPITLLNIAYKVFALLLYKRLSDTVEKLVECQKGFRQNRSTIDYTSIFVIKQIFKSAVNII